LTFSGGGTNQTLPHTHDSLITNDGGSLNMKNITQGAISSGSMTYSDGSHLQELSVGTPTQVMTVSAGNLPVWSAAAAGISCADNLTINGVTHTICEWIEAGQ